jgi:cysteine-rich repeat protein
MQSSGGLTSSAGSAVANGGSAAAEPATGGNAPTAGGPVGNDSAGSPNPPDEQGGAGAPEGVGGSGEPEPPVEPVCGNGVLEAGEQCDDSGHTGQDGCDAACKVVCSHFGSDALASEDHHCYSGYDAADFEGAQADCVERGAHLATISSAAENKIVRSLVNNSKWLGGFEDVGASTKGTGNYAWLSGEPFTYTNWGQGEPDQARVRCQSSSNLNCYEHCVSMLGDGTWADAGCDISDGYVCEWEPAGSQ